MSSRFVASGVLAACLLASVAVAQQEIALPDTARIELDNGTVLLLAERHDVPLVGLRAIIRGGALADPETGLGTASLLAGLLNKGAGDRDAAAFAEAVAAVGGRLQAHADLESLSISGGFLARDAEFMVSLLADMLRSPLLARDEFDKLRERQANLIAAAKDANPRTLPAIYGNRYLFPDHPYGRPVDGSEASLATIPHDAIVDYYADHVGADRLTVAVVGDFETASLSDVLRTALADWRPAAEPVPAVAVPAAADARRVLLVDKPGAAQTYFWLGNVGVSIGYPQAAALDIANTLFGGRFTSLLMDELRTRSGLTYGASSLLRRPAKPGSVAISSYTPAESTTRAIDLTIELLKRLHQNGFSGEQVESGKNYILGQYPLALETAAQLAAKIAELEFYGLDRSFVTEYGNRIAAAGEADVDAVIDAVYPRSNALVFVILGDAERIRDDIAKYGPVVEMSITEPHFLPDQVLPAQ